RPARYRRAMPQRSAEVTQTPAPRRVSQRAASERSFAEHYISIPRKMGRSKQKGGPRAAFSNTDLTRGLLLVVAFWLRLRLGAALGFRGECTQQLFLGELAMLHIFAHVVGVGARGFGLIDFG